MRWDLDDILSYKTTRMVRIRDRRLGLVYWTFVLAIFGYIVGYNVIYKQGYKLKAPITGVVRLQMKAPEEQFTYDADQLPYCGNVNGTYTEIGDSKDDLIEFPKYPCEFYDQYDAVFPEVQPAVIFLTTRLTHEYHILQNSSDVPCDSLQQKSCQYVLNSSDTIYVANPEFFTLYVSHSLSVSEFALSRSANTLRGTLENEKGDVFDPCDPYVERGWECPSYVAVGEIGVRDILPIAAILKAGGVDSLDEIAGSTLGLDSESIRHAGTILLVTIEYSNFFSYNPQEIKYTYRVARISDTEFKEEQVIPQPGVTPPTRTIFDRHGVRIVLVQNGEIGQFDVVQLLLVTVTSVGLIAVANTVVNTTAFGFMPMRHIYQQYRTVQSVDFSDIQHLPKSQLKRFRSEDLINPRPGIFETAGTAQDSAVLLAGSNPTGTRIQKAPNTNQSQTGYFHSIRKTLGIIREESDDIADHTSEGKSTVNPVSNESINGEPQK